jgi:hypothetical protein
MWSSRKLCQLAERASGCLSSATQLRKTAGLRLINSLTLPVAFQVGRGSECVCVCVRVCV